MRHGGGDDLSPPTEVRHSALAWFIARLVVGTVGLFAFVVPLFGFLSYAGVLVLPLAAIAEIGFGIAAVVAGGRWRWAYVLGNLGLVAGNGAILMVSLGLLGARPGGQPNPDTWAPLYFCIRVVGLSGGVKLRVVMAAGPWCC